MKQVFLILGYGIPKDMLKDGNCSCYLRLALNRIYELTFGKSQGRFTIICCGGHVDMFKPYRRTQADELIKAFKAIIKQRPYLHTITNKWVFIPERRSLSTLESLLNSREIMVKRKMAKAEVNILCEYTRSKKVGQLARRVFRGGGLASIWPVDFDQSSNRYLLPRYIEKKEKAEVKLALWALRNKQNRRQYHQILSDRIEYLQTAGTKAHAAAAKKWWDNRIKQLVD